MINEKIEFYVNHNSFENKQKIVGSVSLNDDVNLAYIKIKKNKKEILESINFVFIEDDRDWDIRTCASDKNPVCAINLNSKKDISYLVLYATTAIMLGLDFVFSFSRIRELKINNEAYHFLDAIASNSYYSVADFDIFFVVGDDFADRIFKYGKKFCFSAILAYDEGLISKGELMELLNFDKETTEAFFQSYLPMAIISKRHQATL